MEQDLKLKGFSPATIRNYLLYCRKFAAFFMRSPEELGAAEVRAFLLHQIEVEQLAYTSDRQVYAALKFLYTVTLGRPAEVCRTPFPKHRRGPLPKVFTVDELAAFFAAVRQLRSRALPMTCYAAGLRLSEACHRCGYQRIAYNSCRDRHCPKCQAVKRAEWLQSRLARLLPIPYFHVVFTLPKALHLVVLRNRRLLYDLLFQAASQTLLTLAANPKRLGAQIGVTAILHTWGQNLGFHPHLHCVVTGGGLARYGSR